MTRLTPDQIFKELNDLEPDDPDPPWVSQYEIQEIPNEEYSLEEFHPPEGAPEKGEDDQPSLSDKKEIEVESSET